MTKTNLRWALAAALAVALIAPVAAGADEAPPEPDSYRLSDYRAPTPATLKGARVLTTEEAAAMWRTGDCAFIDVLPQAPRPKNLPADVVWRDKPRFDIPGSLWLPDTGYGELASVMLDYFRRGLDKALGGRTRPLVFYCLKDCSGTPMSLGIRKARTVGPPPGCRLRSAPRNRGHKFRFVEDDQR
jgi:PQQ-dependent catabolism-associated CXXCW motif protein